MEVATQDIAIITLLLIISAVGIATLSLRLPYPIALVLTGASPRPGLLIATPPLASFFGFRSRTLIVFFVSFLCAILFFLAIYLGCFVVLCQ